MQIRTALLLAVSLAGRAAELPDAALAEQVERWRAHYARVERELCAHEPSDLDPAARAARHRLIEALAAYRERGDFTRQELLPGALVPQFVDEEGRRCAVAELLHASERDELVARVATRANTAWIADLAGDPELEAWLAAHGLTLVEAARIQTPAFGAPGDRAPASGDSPLPPATAAPAPDAPVSVRRPLGMPDVASSAGAPSALPGADRAPERPLDAWWVWWEYNKLAYLGVRGLETRLGREARRSEREVATMTEPLRRVREPLLLAQLADEDALVRAAAALALGRIARDRAVEPLARLLSDPSQRVREHALLGLGSSGASEAARILLALIEADGRRPAAGAAKNEEGELVSPHAVPLAILALAIGARAGMEPAIASAVARLAERTDERSREDALWAACLFQRLAPAPALEALALRVLFDGKHERRVRAAAVEALGGSKDPAVLARLQDVLSGRDLELRRSTALALARSPQALALPALMTAYELESEPLARGFALLSIGRHGGIEARDLLLEEFVHGPSVIEPWAALALGIHARDSGDPAIPRVLLEAAPRVRNEDSRPAVLLALGLAREPAAIPLARATLEKSTSARERGYAASTLALLGGAGNREFLRARLAVERSGFVRATIAQALSTLGDQRDAPALFEVLSGLADPGLQAVTAASIGLLGVAGALPGLEELARAESSGLVRATAVDALGVLLERDEPLVLPEASRDANYALYEDWMFDLFQLAL